MTATTVSWTCQRCRASNAAGAHLCVACGVPAWGGRRQSADAASFAEPLSPPSGRDLGWMRSEWRLLVPEIFLASAILLASPFWFWSLETQGRYGASCVLLLGVAQAIFVGRASFRMKSAGGLHVASWVTFVAAAIAGSLSLLPA